MAIRLSSYTVLFDACVLYPAPLRDILMELAASRLFRAKWTKDIQEEWIRNLLAKRTDITRGDLNYTVEQMTRAVPDCLVDGYDTLIQGLTLPDADDRHVLAAAIKAGCDAIITFNLNDFPAAQLDAFGIEAQHPDEFIHHQFGLNHAAVLTAAKSCRGRLKNPPMTAQQYIATLERQGLTKTASELKNYSHLI